MISARFATQNSFGRKKLRLPAKKIADYCERTIKMDKKDEKIELKDSERQPCEVWTRVMGYHRPVSSFNTGKKGEFYERKCFVESKCGLNK